MAWTRDTRAGSLWRDGSEPKVSWQEVYHQFDPTEPLRADDPRLHPELYGSFLETVATRLIVNKDKNLKLLLSGHIGCGKSTFLNLLKERPDIQEHFLPVKYSIRDVLDPNDTHHVDILLSLTLQTIVALHEAGIKADRKLTDKLQEINRELTGVIQKERVETRGQKRRSGVELKAGAGLNAFVSWVKGTLFARFQIENDTRDTVRTHFKPKMTDFLRTINDILTRVQASLGKRHLLILIDDTDKIPPDRGLEVFFENGQHLSTPEASIVFMIDTSLSCSSKYAAIVAKIGGEEFFPAVKTRERDGTESQTTRANIEMLKRLVRKRGGTDFLEDGALSKAVEMSGGVVRELVRILQEVIFHARGNARQDHVDYAIVKIRNGYNLYSEHVRVLRLLAGNPNWFQTAQEDTARLESTLLDLLYMPALFQYRDGEDKWYRPYPIFIPWLQKL